MSPICKISWILLSILFSISATFANSKEYSEGPGTIWDAEDALILDAEDGDSKSRAFEDVTTTAFPISDNEYPTGTCITREGVSGLCMRFDDCYPYLTYSYSESTSDGFMEVVKNISTPCKIASVFSPGGETIPDGENGICCATLSRAAISNNFPKFPLESEGSETGTPIEVPGCGETPYIFGPKIVQGRPAREGEFPWAVAMFYKSKPHCGGSLIDEKTVITAAHCVNSIRTSSMLKQLKLSIGDHDIYDTRESMNELRGVKRLIFHKKFNDRNFRDDIAMMILDSPVTFTKRIKPICLQTGNRYDSGQTTGDIAGWGKISTHGPPSRALRMANIRIWKNSECSTKYRGTPAPPITEGMMCAGGPGGKDSCQGDSGGPLTVRGEDGKECLTGIVSWGINCGQYPGVYTRVDKQLTWIGKYRATLA